jgi:hypothetical protein
MVSKMIAIRRAFMAHFEEETKLRSLSRKALRPFLKTFEADCHSRMMTQQPEVGESSATGGAAYRPALLQVFLQRS